MHPQAVGERPYGNSLGVGKNDDGGVGHFAWSRLLIRHMQRKKRAGKQHVVKRLPAFLLLSAIFMLFPA
jgi:hypothetical protein